MKHTVTYNIVITQPIIVAVVVSLAIVVFSISKTGKRPF